ncbi:hypothetical protein NS334_09810 [Sphingomonas endophytica]|uniref:Plasmid stabilization protein n=2 Tax=Sphingomonas endophytica TaxID=869719 RepID=A0A147I254_9SPHN|nr:hypothetical protein NS334_09810 [Sphingomonas endophytica]
MARVDWTGQALHEIDLIVSCIEQFDPAAAARMSARLLALGDSLASFPNRGGPAEDGLRELTIVPPYILLYETDGEVVSIFSIRHGARRPD